MDDKLSSRVSALARQYNQTEDEVRETLGLGIINEEAAKRGKALMEAYQKAHEGLKLMEDSLWPEVLDKRSTKLARKLARRNAKKHYWEL